MIPNAAALTNDQRSAVAARNVCKHLQHVVVIRRVKQLGMVIRKWLQHGRRAQQAYRLLGRSVCESSTTAARDANKNAAAARVDESIAVGVYETISV
jgi:hypothetical protein